MPPLMQRVKTCMGRQDEGFLQHYGFDEFGVAGVFSLILCPVILPDVGQIFQEQKRQHVVFVN